MDWDIHVVRRGDGKKDCQQSIALSENQRV
jgi:hypothetical protein